ncbi:MAG: hypothetical protein ACJA1C_003336 [Crocinitomicaceae bacterium]|jgi:hypothetical protein
MEKSIEEIWKNGFLKNEALVAPKVNDLYNQKSKNIVDKLLQMGQTNIYAILIGSFIILFVSVITGATIMGLALFFLLGWLVLAGRELKKKVDEIDKSMSSYAYLKAVNSWRNDAIALYTRIYRVFYPLFVLSIGIGFWFSTFGTDLAVNLAEKFPNMIYILGMPLYPLIVLSTIAVLSSVFAGRIYRLDLNIVYGNVFAKIEELIADMDELRS